MKKHLVVCGLLCVLASISVLARGEIKSEDFGKDPGWEGFNNRQKPEKWPVVAQDFGWRESNHAGAAAGEVGGQVWRTSRAAYYARKLDKALKLDQAISFSGNFSIPTARGGGVKLGLFNPDYLPQGGRPNNSLMLDINGAKKIVQTFVRMIAVDNQQTGTPVPFATRVKDMPGIPADGSKHHFSIEYDPAGEGGAGVVRGKVDDLPEAKFVFRPGFKELGFLFTHFGILNTQKSGSPIEVYFDDLKLNGEEMRFDKDPGWEAHGNSDTYEDHDPAGFENYGFDQARFAGGVGGNLWRNEKGSYYGDKVGPFDATQKLEASGTVRLEVGMPDSGAWIGFF